MKGTRVLVTGATGFVGSHVAEAFVQRGATVVTLARPQSNTAFLETLGIEIVRGDLTEPEAIRRATQGVDIVVHCAAKVGDWGPHEDYRIVNVGGLRQLLEAVRNKPLQRFVHMSSLGVYAARHHYGTDESVPVPDRHMDGYTTSKVESEKVALQYHRDHQVPLVVLRPGFVYGPRDRIILWHMIRRLREGKIRYIGDSSLALNTIYVGNLVDAVFLAIEKPQAVGQIYNLTDDEHVTKRQFMEAVSDLAGVDRPTKSIPLFLARPLAWGLDKWFKLRKRQKAPRLTQARLKFLGLNLGFSVEKAKRELGYVPRVKFAEGIEEAMTWWKGEVAAEEARARTVLATGGETAPVRS